ncbi:MAG: response regulator [Sphingobacteriales bacterium]|nr:MAG: response regulator [Sphingobacteriales bacterium]
MKKIFHIDDNEELVEITEIILGKDYEVRSRSTVEGIAGELRNFNPDLILIDHFIGELNSEEILKDIHTEIPDFSIPVVLYSASYDIEEKARKLGASGFIEKPSSIQYIKDYISQFFNKAS